MSATTSSKYELFRIDYNQVVDDSGIVAEVVLNAPQRLNTMNEQFFAELHLVFAEIEENPAVRAVVLWAEGKLFTAGLNLKDAVAIFSGGEESSEVTKNIKLLQLIQRWQAAITRINKCKKPVIAAIHGGCIGGGVDLVTACDVRLCTADATFSIKETKLAIVADLGTLQRISRLAGKGVAREMAFTGNDLGAARAKACGLVNEVYPDKETMLVAARAMAKTIASNSPLVVQATKLVMNYADEHNTEDSLQQVALWNAAFLKSEDLTEAVMAFMQRREPKFKSNL